jgi:hypothetical protein
MPTNEQINKESERKHFNHQDKVVSYIEKQYNAIMAQIIPLIERGAANAIIERKLNQLLKVFVKNITGAVESGVKYSWTTSHAKNVAFFEKRLEGYDIPAKVKEALFKPNHNRMEAFIKRKENGLTLSDRVWKSAEQFKNNVDMALDIGVAEGKSAKQIGRELRQDLQEPDRLFRRVRDAKGKLKLSKPAKSYNPGQGVYRSAAKNSERLARTTINMAYRAADGAAYADNPLVLGYEISLSATAKPKTRCELCRSLAGVYPVWFVWNGWHPNCLCFKIPVLMTDGMMAKYQKLVARGEDSPEAIKALQASVRIEVIPDAAKKWLNDNNDRIMGWKSLPYFYRDNKDFIVRRVLIEVK